VQISTFRWAIASFLAGVAALALGSIPLVAVCVGAGGEAFERAAFVGVVVAAACLLVVVVTLDVLGARGRRTAHGRAARRRPRGRSGGPVRSA
jgi:hypothetical protein